MSLHNGMDTENKAFNILHNIRDEAEIMKMLSMRGYTIAISMKYTIYAPSSIIKTYVAIASLNCAIIIMACKDCISYSKLIIILNKDKISGACTDNHC